MKTNTTNRKLPRPRIFERAARLVAEAEARWKRQEDLGLPFSLGYACHAIERAAGVRPGEGFRLAPAETILFRNLFFYGDGGAQSYGCSRPGGWWPSDLFPIHPDTGFDFGSRIVALQLAAEVAKDMRRQRRPRGLFGRSSAA